MTDVTIPFLLLLFSLMLHQLYFTAQLRKLRDKVYRHDEYLGDHEDRLRRGMEALHHRARDELRSAAYHGTGNDADEVSDV